MVASSKRGTTILIRSNYLSIQEMLNGCGDDYHSLSELDSYDYGHGFRDAKILNTYNKLYNFSPNHKFVFADPSDRSCIWRNDFLCIYREVILPGFRFPFHPFNPLI